MPLSKKRQSKSKSESSYQNPRKSRRLAGKPPKQLRKSKNKINYQICEICHEKLAGRKNKTYPCGHTFHINCIYKWIDILEKQGLPLTCPKFRRTIKQRKRFLPRFGQNTLDMFSYGW